MQCLWFLGQGIFWSNGSIWWHEVHGAYCPMDGQFYICGTNGDLSVNANDSSMKGNQWLLHVFLGIFWEVFLPDLGGNYWGVSTHFPYIYPCFWWILGKSDLSARMGLGYRPISTISTISTISKISKISKNIEISTNIDPLLQVSEKSHKTRKLNG